MRISVQILSCKVKNYAKFHILVKDPLFVILVHKIAGKHRVKSLNLSKYISSRTNANVSILQVDVSNKQKINCLFKKISQLWRCKIFKSFSKIWCSKSWWLWALEKLLQIFWLNSNLSSDWNQKLKVLIYITMSLFKQWRCLLFHLKFIHYKEIKSNSLKLS